MISHRHHHARAAGAGEARRWRVAPFSGRAPAPRPGAYPGRLVASALWSRTRRLSVVLFLNLGLVTALVVAGIAAHSLAAAAAGADCLADAAAVGVSLLAIWLAGRPPSPARPRGYPQATAIAALVNAGWLLALNVAIAAAAIWRLTAGSRVEGLPVLVVSAIAAVVMLAGALILRGDPGGDDLNVKAVLLDTAGDAAAAGGVAVSGAIILGTGWYWLDPATALVIAVIVGYHAQKLTRTIIAALRSPSPVPASR